MLWIPITVAAALAQTLRNAAQRSLTGELGTWGATLVRFLFGLPFTVLWLGGELAFRGGQAAALPDALSASFFGWLMLGGVAQVLGTGLLLYAISKHNFALGIAYSKTEIIQVALFAVLFLNEDLSVKVGLAIALAFAGVVLVSWPKKCLGPGKGLGAAAVLGLASGSAFALSSVGFRGATVELQDFPPDLAAASALVAAQTIQTALLGGWLLASNPRTVVAACRAWRTSLLAGFLGAFASALWFTAFAMQPVSQVRTLGMVELLFGYLVSARIFQEKLMPREMAGFAVLCAGLLCLVWPS